MKQPNEPLPRLRAALDKYNAATKDAADHSKLEEEAQTAIADFASTGDLRDLEAISKIAPRQAQAGFLQQRLGLVRAAADTAEQELGEAVTTARAEIVGAADKVRCGIAEKSARAIEEHFESRQAARRQALSSSAAKDRAGVKYRIENIGLNEEAPEVAREFLEMAPGLFDEVGKLEKELGGKIPTEGEMIAQ